MNYIYSVRNTLSRTHSFQIQSQSQAKLNTSTSSTQNDDKTTCAVEICVMVGWTIIRQRSTYQQEKREPFLRQKEHVLFGAVPEIFSSSEFCVAHRNEQDGEGREEDAGGLSCPNQLAEDLLENFAGYFFLISQYLHLMVSSSSPAQNLLGFGYFLFKCNSYTQIYGYTLLLFSPHSRASTIQNKINKLTTVPPYLVQSSSKP